MAVGDFVATDTKLWVNEEALTRWGATRQGGGQPTQVWPTRFLGGQAFRRGYATITMTGMVMVVWVGQGRWVLVPWRSDSLMANEHGVDWAVGLGLWEGWRCVPRWYSGVVVVVLGANAELA